MYLTAQDPSQIDSWELLLFKAVNRISLTPSQYQLIDDRYSQLQKILNVADDEILKDAHIFVQGSIELKTTIKPASRAKDDMATVDADAIVWLPYARNASSSEILALLEKRFKEGSRVTTPIERLRRGIRIVYADENPGFHIDVTPARCVRDNYELNGYGCLEVPDRHIGWKCSSPREYSEWLKGVSKKEIKIIKTIEKFAANRSIIADSATQDPMPVYADYVEHNPLRATIKLLKRHRDEWAISSRKEDVRPISAILTTLAAHAYEIVALESQSLAVRPIEAMIKIIAYMPQFISRNQEGYAVLNPKDVGENFAEKWNRPDGEGQKYVEAFNSWHIHALESVQIGLNDLGSQIAFEDAVIERLGVSRTFIQELVNETPNRKWTLPGRSANTSLNTLSLSALAGIATASSTSQAQIEPVGRLG